VSTVLRDSDLVLRDGTLARVRPVVAADREALDAFLPIRGYRPRLAVPYDSRAATDRP